MVQVRTICGKANSPTLSARTFRFKELDSMKRKPAKGWQGRQAPEPQAAESGDDSEATFKIPDVPKPGAAAEEVADWGAEVRPSMRKLRQGMDSLLKTSRLVCSVLRLQQVASINPPQLGSAPWPLAGHISSSYGTNVSNWRILNYGETIFAANAPPVGHTDQPVLV